MSGSGVATATADSAGGPQQTSGHATESAGLGGFVKHIRLVRTPSTSESDEASPSDSAKVGYAPLATVYPHVFDEAAPAGQAVVLVKQAAVDAQRMLDAFDAGDMLSIQSRLSLVAASLAKAESLGDLDRGFCSAVAFIRRAVIVMPADEATRPGVNALVSGLRTLAANPLVGMPRAADLANQLTAHGWRGDHDALEHLLAELLGEGDSEESKQPDLFSSKADA